MDIIEWLTGPEAAEHIARHTPYRADTALASTQELRRSGLSPEQASAVLTQARLRTAAVAKFPGQDAMFFTQAGYEQSSRWTVATAHAAAFVSVGVRTVTDLGCGIGADSRAFAEAGLEVTAIESDPATAAFAQANVPAATVIVADGTEIRLPSTDALWLDPARRTPSGKRITHPEDWSPSFSRALQLASEYRVSGIKVAPGIPHELLPAASRTVWSSEGGTVVEATVWQGVGSSGRFAVVDGVEFDSGASAANEPIEFVTPSPLRSLLLEPDGALIRAGAIASLCTGGAAPVSDGIAYLSGDSPIEGCAAFEVLDVVPHNTKKIAAALRQHGLTATEIKKRGTDASPEALRAQLAKIEGDPGVVILSPVLGRHRAIIARRLPPSITCG